MVESGPYYSVVTRAAQILAGLLEDPDLTGEVRDWISNGLSNLRMMRSLLDDMVMMSVSEQMLAYQFDLWPTLSVALACCDGLLEGLVDSPPLTTGQREQIGLVRDSLTDMASAIRGDSAEGR